MDDINKVVEDMMIYGSGFMKDGKHIPFKEAVNLSFENMDALIKEQAKRLREITQNYHDLNLKYEHLKSHYEVLKNPSPDLPEKD